MGEHAASGRGFQVQEENTRKTQCVHCTSTGNPCLPPVATTVCVSVCLCIRVRVHVAGSFWQRPLARGHVFPQHTSWLPLILRENTGRVVGGASGQHLALTKHRLWESWGRAGHSRVYCIYQTQKPLKCHAPHTPYRHMNSAMSNKRRALSGGKINPCGENRALSLADMSHHSLQKTRVQIQNSQSSALTVAAVADRMFFSRTLLLGATTLKEKLGVAKGCGTCVGSQHPGEGLWAATARAGSLQAPRSCLCPPQASAHTHRLPFPASQRLLKEQG